MTWRDQVKGPATFRGVPFFVDTAELGGGRRTVTHEYPLRDDPFVEDMGRAARTFPVEGYVLGANYIAARNLLLAALEEPDAGDLVHPYYGKRRVMVSDFRVRESLSEGGVARFSITFAETAPRSEPTATTDAAGTLESSAAAARTAVQAEFSSKYSPGALMDSVGNSLRAATLVINNQLAKSRALTGKFALLKRRVTALESSAAALVTEPADIVAALDDVLDLVTSRPLLFALYGYSPGEQPPDTTPTRQTERENFDALQRLLQRLALIRAAELAIDETFTSYDEAVAARDSIADLLDEQAELVSDDTYPALLQLRADLVNAVPGEDGDLPRLLEHTPRVTEPSLVLAFRLYGNVDHEADLIDRNHVRNPAYVPGGRVLEVLSA